MVGRIVLAAVSVIALTAAAKAADMYVPAPAGPGGYKDAAPVASDWSGFYIGINGGGGWAQTDYPPSIFLAALPTHSDPKQNSSGGLVGGQAGYNWQYGRFVGGLEVDFDAADIKSTSSLPFAAAGSVLSQEVKIDQLASVRGRLGWEVQPNLVAYGTAGLGLAHFQSTLISAPTPYTLHETVGDTELGWVAGAGLEYKLFDHWLLRAEYLHYGFGRDNNMIQSPNAKPPLSSLDAQTAVDVVRGGLSYKFGPVGSADAGLKDTASVSDWSGFYIGINGGGGWGQTAFPSGFTLSTLSTEVRPPNQNSSGGLAGGQFGYNWQYGRAVAGLEADFDVADIKSTSNLAVASAPSAISQQVKTGELASVRARLGWTVRPDLMAYGTAGLALGHFKSSDTQASPYFATGGGATELGWAAGAGLEYKLLDHLLLRAEYLHYDFGSVTNLPRSSGSQPPVDSALAQSSVDIVRGGVSYKFGPEGAADSGLKDPGYVSNWSGLYAGVNGGGGWAHTDYLLGVEAPSVYKGWVPQPPAQSSSGGLIGGHLGYNWQYERLVGGVEGDFDLADLKSTANLAFAAPSVTSQVIKIDELASVRARLGWEVRPDLLAYGAGGFGLGHFQSTLTNATPATAPAPFFKSTGGVTEFGWVAGAGLEYKILDHWLLRAEYLHYDFGDVNSVFGAASASPRIDPSYSRTTVDAVRGGLSYKF